MTRQDQRVAEGGQAIQAQGDVNINQGITPEQMITIMDGVAQQMQRGVDQAAVIVENRLKQFEKSILSEFSRPNTEAKPEAFQDPDFQYALHEAQKGFARSGENELLDELVKLLSQRSVESGRTRKALILNEAIQTVGNLTQQELSVASVLFIFQYVQVQSAPGMGNLVARYKQWMAAFAGSFPSDDFSIDYLSSMKCLNINPISSTTIWKILSERYGNIFTRGFTASDLAAVLGAAILADVDKVVQPISGNPHGRLRFSPRNKAELEKAIDDQSITGQLRTDLLALWDSSTLPEEEAKQFWIEHVPELATISDRWDQTAAKSSHLTGLGKAIAHSALNSRTDFKAPLDIWVK